MTSSIHDDAVDFGGDEDRQRIGEVLGSWIGGNGDARVLDRLRGGRRRPGEYRNICWGVEIGSSNSGSVSNSANAAIDRNEARIQHGAGALESHDDTRNRATARTRLYQNTAPTDLEGLAVLDDVVNVKLSCWRIEINTELCTHQGRGKHPAGSRIVEL